MGLSENRGEGSAILWVGNRAGRRDRQGGIRHRQQLHLLLGSDDPPPRLLRICWRRCNLLGVGAVIVLGGVAVLAEEHQQDDWSGQGY